VKADWNCWMAVSHNDSFDNRNGNGQSFVKQDDIWQPRLSFY